MKGVAAMWEVLIYWRDAGSQDTYVPLEAAEALGSWDAVTRGLLYYEDERDYKVAQESHTRGDEILLRELKAIPKISVVKVERVMSVKEIYKNANL